MPYQKPALNRTIFFLLLLLASGNLLTAQAPAVEWMYKGYPSDDWDTATTGTFIQSIPLANNKVLSVGNTITLSAPNILGKFTQKDAPYFLLSHFNGTATSTDKNERVIFPSFTLKQSLQNGDFVNYYYYMGTVHSSIKLNDSTVIAAVSYSGNYELCYYQIGRAHV